MFDGIDVEWAIATRVQADKDVLIIPGARSKPLDPSIPPSPGRIPTTAKMGVDATIPEDMPRERFERISYAYADHVKLEDFLGDGPAKTPVAKVLDDEILALAKDVRATITNQPQYFAELAERFADRGFQTLARALGHLHENEELWQDRLGHFCLAGSKFAATPPK